MPWVWILIVLMLQNICSGHEGINFALNKSTSQSSIAEGGISSRAVDGYKNPYYSEKSCIQTNLQYEPWWTVDLQEKIYVTSVEITNRKDCCSEELANFDVRVGDESSNGGINNALCAPTYTLNAGPGETILITCIPPALGRYLTVAIVKSGGKLNFCEVAVYGYQKKNVFHIKIVSYGKNSVRSGKRSYARLNYASILYPYKRGIYVHAYNMTTGEKVASKSFDTLYDKSTQTTMPAFLGSLPREVFIVMLLNDVGHKYYKTSIPLLQEFSGAPFISTKLTWSDAWSLLGYHGQLPSPSWRSSVMKKADNNPAVIENIIPKLIAPANQPSNIIIVDVTSSSISLTWSRPPDIFTQDKMPLNYTVCLGQTGDLNPGCINLENSHYYYADRLKTLTKYTVSVQANSYGGFGPMASIGVTTLEKDSFKIHVKLVSRIKEDVLYRPVNKPCSTITIRGQAIKFSSHGHHFVILDAKTGVKMSQMSFDTHQKPESGKEMATFLSGLPNKMIILMVVYYQAHDHYNTSSGILTTICPEAPSNYTSKRSWSMVCLKSTGSVIWAESKLSIGNNGPAVVQKHILLPKDLTAAPVLTKALTKTSSSVEVHWLHPATNDYTGKLLGFQICYQEFQMVGNNCSLVQFDNGNLESGIINNLRPFQKYKVKIRGSVALNYGPYSNTMTVSTEEAEPSTGPTDVIFAAVRSSSLVLEWSPPTERNRNGVITKYSICFQKTTDENSCVETFNFPADHTTYEVRQLKPYVLYKFLLKAATVVGYGPATVVFRRTSQAAPEGAPIDLRVTYVNVTSVVLSWLPPVPEQRNGIITNYKICVRMLSSSLTCLIDLWIGNGTSQVIVDLKPYTTYEFRVSAATLPGVGPSALVVNRTLQAAPSGSPTRLGATFVNQTHIVVTWSAPVPTEINGVLTQYYVCITPESKMTCQQQNTIPVSQTSYVFDKLSAFKLYNITVSAATYVGVGPAILLTQRTQPSAPSGPPTMAVVTFINKTTIAFSWSPPVLELRNGEIKFYKLCLRQYGNNLKCSKTLLLPETTTNYFFKNLNPAQEYSISIKAGTVVGYGPAVFVQKTAGECNLPVLYRGGVISDKSFTASGYLGDNYEPHRARIDSNMPWCDRGSHKGAYVQIDLGRKLRFLGVSTKGHIRHWRSWVSSYYVLYSINARDWMYATIAGEKVFQGNTDDGEQSVTNFLDKPVLTRFVRFQIIDFVGLHKCMRVEIYGCSPASSVEFPAIQSISSSSITVTWNAMLDKRNGDIYGYKICSKQSSSTLECTDSVFVKNNVLSHVITKLKPFTSYAIEISASTIAGYGNPAVFHAQTNQSVPSGAPFAIMAHDVTAVSLQLVWSPPEQRFSNGIITKYTICYQEAVLRTNCDRMKNVSGNQQSYNISSLQPNTEYVIQVMASTVIGLGPPGAIYVTTLSAAPSGPPTLVSVSQLGPTALQISWFPPEPKKRNGLLVGYRVCCIKETGTTQCHDYVSLPAQQTTYSVTGLKPNTAYKIHVGAKTVMGYGPPYVTSHMTAESVPTSPPKNVIVESFNSTSIELTWDPPEVEKRNGVLTSYEIIVLREITDSKVEKLYSLLIPPTKTTWENTKLSPNTDYIFHLRAGTAKGFGPALIIHKKTEGSTTTSFQRTEREEKMTTGGVAGGAILVVVLIIGGILSVLWNKGLLPYTRLYREKNENIKKSKEHRKRRRRRRRKRRRKRRRRKNESDPTDLHATESVYSELNDYDALPVGTKNKQKELSKMVTLNDLYGTHEDMNEQIHDNVTHVPGQVLYYDGLPATRGEINSEDLYGTLAGLRITPGEIARLDDVEVTFPNTVPRKPIDSSKSAPLPNYKRLTSLHTPANVRQTVSALTVITPPVPKRAKIVDNSVDVEPTISTPRGESTSPRHNNRYRHSIISVKTDLEPTPITFSAPQPAVTSPREVPGLQPMLQGWCRRSSVPSEKDPVEINFSQPKVHLDGRQTRGGSLLSMALETVDSDTLLPVKTLSRPRHFSIAD